MPGMAYSKAGTPRTSRLTLKPNEMLECPQNPSVRYSHSVTNGFGVKYMCIQISAPKLSEPLFSRL